MQSLFQPEKKDMLSVLLLTLRRRSDAVLSFKHPSQQHAQGCFPERALPLVIIIEA